MTSIFTPPHIIRIHSGSQATGCTYMYIHCICMYIHKCRASVYTYRYSLWLCFPSESWLYTISLYLIDIEPWVEALDLLLSLLLKYILHFVLGDLHYRKCPCSGFPEPPFRDCFKRAAVVKSGKLSKVLLLTSPLSSSPLLSLYWLVSFISTERRWCLREWLWKQHLWFYDLYMSL